MCDAWLLSKDYGTQLSTDAVLARIPTASFPGEGLPDPALFTSVLSDLRLAACLRTNSRQPFQRGGVLWFKEALFDGYQLLRALSQLGILQRIFLAG